MSVKKDHRSILSGSCLVNEFFKDSLRDSGNNISQIFAEVVKGGNFVHKKNRRILMIFCKKASRDPDVITFYSFQPGMPFLLFLTGKLLEFFSFFEGKCSFNGIQSYGGNIP